MTDFPSAAASPLLTVAIPTWNRAAYLATNLAQLRSELAQAAPGTVEVMVSDNCSPDSTPEVVQGAMDSGMSIRYVRNEKNLGWALNFLQCFELARGEYVLLLGDDDLFVDGALPLLLDRLAGKEYGVVCLRPYGFDEDFRKEHPGGSGRERTSGDPNEFLVAISKCFTLTSACVLNKSLLSGVDSRQFSQTNLAVFHLLLRAALAAGENLYVDGYLIASKRQNSFAYEYADVFVKELWQIMDAHLAYGLSREAVAHRREGQTAFLLSVLRAGSAPVRARRSEADVRAVRRAIPRTLALHLLARSDHPPAEAACDRLGRAHDSGWSYHCRGSSSRDEVCLEPAGALAHEEASCPWALGRARSGER